MSFPRTREFSDSETADSLLSDHVKLIQAKHGYRAAIDSLLLADFARAETGRCVDLGCGAGVVSLALARLSRLDEIVGVEMQSQYADRARRGVELNRLAGHVMIVESGVVEFAALAENAEKFDVVVANPPFFATRGQGYESDLARHEGALTVERLCGAARRLLVAGGRIYLVFAAARIDDLVPALKRNDLRDVTMRLVFPRPDKPAHLVLVRATKKSGGTTIIALAPPLTLSDKMGVSTAEAANIAAGRFDFAARSR